MATIKIEGLEELQDKFAAVIAGLSGDRGMIERAEHATLERLRDEVAAQPWGAGNFQFPVKTGALRDSGRVDGGVLYWDDLEYAHIIEARGGFFEPIVRERGPVIFREELQRELDAALGD